ncbi:MAG: ABC transporter ATP-binding protein [Chloroflexota bacterium]
MKHQTSSYKRLFAYLLSYKKTVAIAYGSAIMTVLFKLAVPQIVKTAIDDGLATGNANALYEAGGIILVLAIVTGATFFGMMYLGMWLTYRIAYDLRNQFYEKVQALAFSFHDQAQTGDLMSRATSDVRETEMFIGIGLRDLLTTILLILGVMIAMFIESSSLAILALVPFPILIFTAIRFGAQIRTKFRLVQEQMGNLGAIMQESMAGIGVVKAFAREPYEIEKFTHENEAWFDGRFGVLKIWGRSWPFFMLLLGTSTFLLLWFGGPRALQGELTIGSLFAMISYVLLLNGPIQRLGFQVNMASTAIASAERLFEIFDATNDITEPENAVDMQAMRGEVTFEHVHFAYDDEKPTLQDISFQALPGQTIALMGLTGSGKSTITNLIPRFYDVTEGRVLIDDVDVRHMSLPTLRHHIGMVLQDPLLFSATVAENIAYGRPDAPMADILEAAKVAGAHKFIDEFPNGYDTIVGERGVTLSGGQKQRIAIARALVRNPRILILDDSTSAVDTETEYVIQQALSVLMEDRTTFVIAQRLLTLKNADLILVLEKGQIVQRGTHDQLLQEDGIYRQIYDLQLRDQEELQATLANQATVVQPQG